MAMRQVDIDDVPPPPYSETDIYSTAGTNPDSNHNAVSPRIAPDDAASRVSSHASSSHSEVIFTPPLTPRTSGSGGIIPQQQQRRHGQNDSVSNASLTNHPRGQPSTAVADFATAYFDSRPPPALSPREQLVHTIALAATSTPDDVPYSSSWAARDVTRQDWATFTNVLIPHHAATRNEDIINRKLRAEEEAAAAASAASSGGSVSGQGTRNSHSHASAQLEQIRPDPETDPDAADAIAGTGLRREEAESVVAQWNKGFFGPRRMLIRLNLEIEPLRMPGAWNQSFDRNVDSPVSAGPRGPSPMPFAMHPGVSGPLLQPPSPASRSWNFAGIRLSEDGISVGDRIVVDSNGIRVGSLIADERGIRFDGSSNTPPSAPQHAGPPWHAPPGPGPGFGLGIPQPGPFGSAPHMQPAPPPGPPPPEHPHFQHAHGSRARAGRGRGQSRHCSGRRSSSTVSTSSASSTSSSSTTSSVGSLPDYDELCPAQIPLYKSRVTSWLSHPEQLVTKSDVAQLRSEIRSLASTNRGASGSAADPAQLPVDEKALKAEIKALTQEWRKLKRQQRAMRRERKRERRARRREEKRERREQKRESRRERRENWHGGHNSRGNHHQPPVIWGAPPPFPPPGVHSHVTPAPALHAPPAPPNVPPPQVMHTPPVPNFPPNTFPWHGPQPVHPHPFRQPFPGRGTWSGNFGRGWGRGFERSGSEGLAGGFPGAWPGGVGPASPASPAPPSSQSLFRAVDDMERELAQKVEELDKVRYEQRERELEGSSERGRCGRGRGRGWGGGWGRGGSLGDEQIARRLEEVIDEMSKNVDKLRVEADAEFARELAAEDERKGGSGW
ncbi:hypothetical protein C8034_v008761 [Colletotrichum sidae]|uniref:RING finger domain-containing protein n=1 Tax=Colletotrichum sidae TaxID=1347389 RepID=A0A4R8TQ59_9PEZI|nr:hypothetical protein C8034_v008761 [Colletotrichum sidae]